MWERRHGLDLNHVSIERYRRALDAAPTLLDKNSVNLVLENPYMTGPDFGRLPPSNAQVERFSSLPQLASRFFELTGQPSFRLESGAKAYFADFRDYFNADDRPDAWKTLSFPPDPSDFLAFPTAKDELRLATSKMDQSSLGQLSICNLFKIDEQLLERPIGTLSGGERATVALAKAYILSGVCERAVFANPVSWLDTSRLHIAEIAIDSFLSKGKAATVLLLDGEWPDYDGSVIPQFEPEANLPLKWNLKVDDAVFEYAGKQFPHESKGKTIYYKAGKKNLDLESPTLIKGANGIGKSTLAFVLAGILRLVEGQIQTSVSGLSGFARIMMQHISLQLFAMSSIDHMEFSFKYDRERRKKCLESFQNFDERVVVKERQALPEFILGEVDNSGARNSLFHAKLAIALERIILRPPLLILDEPGWGLSADLARCLVAEIVRRAHESGVAVAVISHEDHWLRDFTRSTLFLEQGAENAEVQIRRA